MTNSRTILVIDDSSTIRQLVDRTLSRDGYAIILAQNAEDGLAFAQKHHPDLILLDHQLPGTTGLKVCEHLVEDPTLNHIPVVVSSTLRKKAYLEYADMDNVVDMLPKPYTEELLLTTVSNALDTGLLVVSSQTRGTAVPEVIRQQSDSDLSGSFKSFSVREVIDLLNNGRKSGVLRVDGQDNRYSIYLEDGRVLGVAATGIPAAEVVNRLPESLKELAPVLNVTMSRGGAALDSIVELLNTDVLDPRLLRKLLRHQAAVLLVRCFGEPLDSFRFESDIELPPLFQKLPLDVSVLALLVEGACVCSIGEIPAVAESATFVRQPIRGQNLDRAGLSAKQSLVLGQLTASKTLIEIADAVGGEVNEVRAILHGLELAELVHCSRVDEGASVREVIVLESDVKLANALNKAFANSDNYRVTVVNDTLAARLLARRTSPHVIVADARDEERFQDLRTAVREPNVKWIATSDYSDDVKSADVVLQRPYDAVKLLDALDYLQKELSDEVLAVAE